jgi:phosphoserine aminotransferase
LIDIAFFSVQKGFGLPSGLGVLIVNDILVQHSDIQGYHSYSSLAKKEKVFQTPETPNVLAIFLLGKVVEDMLKIGIARIRKLTEEKARLIEKCLQTYPHKGAPFIKNREVRSQTVFVVEFGKKAEEVVKRLASKGLIVGKGYGEYKDTQIRIANFPQHSILHMQTLVNELGNILKEIRQ